MPHDDGAMLMFKHLRGKDVSQMAEGDLEDMLALMYCCLKSACRAEGVDMAMSFEDFCDRITPDDLNAWNKQMAEADDAKKALALSGDAESTEAGELSGKAESTRARCQLSHEELMARYREAKKRMGL